MSAFDLRELHAAAQLKLRCLLAVFAGGPFTWAGAGGFKFDWGKGLANDMSNTAAAVLAHGVDGPEVDVLVGGRLLGNVPLADYRFEGFVNPDAYLDEAGSLRTMRSPWAESSGDVREALRWAHENTTRLRAIVTRKRTRFRFGRSWDPTPRLPGYFRTAALDANAWLEQLRDVGIALSGSFINFGAADGKGDDPLYAVAMEVQGSGRVVPQLAVEADPDLCGLHRKNLPRVHLACTRVTPQNTRSLVAPVFASPSSKQALDVLKLDIDSYEAFVLEECLWRIGLHPKLILIEINAGIPPPFQYALHDSPQLRAASPSVALDIGRDRKNPLEVNMPVGGVSLSYLVQRLAPDYLLLALGSPDAIFVRKDILKELGREPLDEFKAYESSWVDTHGFSRKQLRRWHFELDEIEGLGEIHDYLTDWMRRYLGVVLPFVLSY